MLGKLLRRVLVPEQKRPETVCWSAEVEGHSSDKSGKQIIHGDIILDVATPRFDRDRTWVYLITSNTSRKALGFGAAGIVLTVTTGEKTVALPCKALELVEDNYRHHQNIMVNGGQLQSSFAAVFDPTPRPTRAEVVIQANRILAAPLLFSIPFDIPSEGETNA
jgi:hypothetical protein